MNGYKAAYEKNLRPTIEMDRRQLDDLKKLIEQPRNPIDASSKTR